MIRTLPTLAAALLAVVATFATTGRADAQTRSYAASLTGGSGLSVGNGPQTAVLAHTPVFLDASLRTMRSDEPALTYGGSLRVEVDGRVGIRARFRARTHG